MLGGRYVILAHLLNAYELIVLVDGIIYKVSESIDHGTIHKGTVI